MGSAGLSSTLETELVAAWLLAISDRHDQLRKTICFELEDICLCLFVVSGHGLRPFSSRNLRDHYDDGTEFSTMLKED